MTISRRSALKGIVAAGAITSASACTYAHELNEAPLNKALTIPPEPNDVLLNHPHAVEVMHNQGVDLLLCADPVNIYYLTNQQPISDLIGMDGFAYAALSSSSKRKPTFIGGQLGYYFDAPKQAVQDKVDLRFYSSPAEPELFKKIDNASDLVNAKAAPGYMPKNHQSALQSPLESKRLKQVEVATSELSASIDAAIVAEILRSDLPNKTIAVDNLRLRQIIKRSELDVRIVDGERLIRRIRLKKSLTEIQFMRYVAQANSISGLTAAQAVREGANFRELRGEFWKEAGRQMCNAKYLMIDTHTPALADGDIKNGRSFLIDCVSEFQGYHGDYGRTVCVGEPNRKLQSVINTLSTVWDRILPELRPGLAYSDIYALANKLFSESKVDAGFAVNPHSVGLHHSDEPSAVDFSYFQKENLVLTENMVLSVDMPVLDTGMGGTAHLEDLVLIGKDGPELLNDTGNRFIVV